MRVPAAWLIERAGLARGDGDGPVGLSTKHPLAIVNRGGATAADVVRFAARVKRAGRRSLRRAGCGPSRSSSAFGRDELPILSVPAESAALMSTLVIEGGHRLEGRVAVEGNKNAALPLMAACLLTEDECVLTNVPRIGDVEVMARLLLDLGAEVDGIGTTTLRIRAAARHDARARPRAGRAAARIGAAARPAAGAHRAARTSRRPAATSRRGARSARTWRRCGAWARGSVDGPDHVLEAPDGLKRRVDLPRRGVGDRHRDGAARGGRGAAASPRSATPPPSRTSSSCASSCAKMGAGVVGQRHRSRSASKACRGCAARRTTLGGDYIEAGSWAVVGAITGGEMEIDGARAEDMEVVAAVLQRMNVECGMRDGVFHGEAVEARRRRGRITTGLWPAFPSDLVSLVTVLATQAEGRTLVHDWMYELRLFALEQMSGMGADLFLADAHRIIVTGPTQLRGGRTLDSRDLRSGMSLIAAALAAEGQSRVDAARDRGARLQPAGRAAAAALGARGREGRVGRRRLDVGRPAAVLRRRLDRRGRPGGGGGIGRRRGRGPGGGCGCRRQSRRRGGGDRRHRAASIGRPPSPSRPTRNGRRSSSVRSSTRTMRGVSVRMMSVSCVSRPVVREQPADDRHVAQAGHARQHPALVVADQAGQHVRLAVAAAGSRC